MIQLASRTTTRYLLLFFALLTIQKTALGTDDAEKGEHLGLSPAALSPTATPDELLKLEDGELGKDTPLSSVIDEKPLAKHAAYLKAIDPTKNSGEQVLSPVVTSLIKLVELTNKEVFLRAMYRGENLSKNPLAKSLIKDLQGVRAKLGAKKLEYSKEQIAALVDKRKEAKKNLITYLRALGNTKFKSTLATAYPRPKPVAPTYDPAGEVLKRELFSQITLTKRYNSTKHLTTARTRPPITILYLTVMMVTGTPFCPDTSMKLRVIRKSRASEETLGSFDFGYSLFGKIVKSMIMAGATLHPHEEADTLTRLTNFDRQAHKLSRAKLPKGSLFTQVNSLIREARKQRISSGGTDPKPLVDFTGPLY